MPPAEAAVDCVADMVNVKMCEGCGLKTPSYGLPAEVARSGGCGRRRWCGGCAAAEGSGAGRLHRRKMCEGCGLKQPNFGLPAEGRRRWCAGCAKGHAGASLSRVVTLRSVTISAATY